MSGPPLIAVSLTQADVDAGFRCGIEELDQFFREHALRNDQAGLGRTYVLRREIPDQPQILGFYTLSMSNVKGEKLADAPTDPLPNYPLPVTLLGRFAIEESQAGKGLGGRLLGDALIRAACAADIVGACGVMTDAKNERAVRFYEKHGFVLLRGMKANPDGTPRYPRPMFLPMATIRAAFFQPD